MSAGKAAGDLLPCVEIRASAVDVPLLLEALGSLDLAGFSWTNAETRVAVVWVCAESADEAEQLCQRIGAALCSWLDLLQGKPPVTVVGQLRQEDWGNSWRRFFCTFRASRRLLLKPSWETCSPSPGDILLEIDPGMCFGTGYHGTTRACLEFMDDLAARLGPVSFLDVGCGSGILSLAAVKLGFRPVRAIDHDPQAVQATRENLARAGVCDVAVAVADMAEYVPDQRCRVVVANVLATVLEVHRQRLCDWLDTSAGPGFLVLSGILNEQYPRLRDAYLVQGFEEIGRRTIDEWTSGCFERNPKRAQVGCP